MSTSLYGAYREDVTQSWPASPRSGSPRGGGHSCAYCGHHKNDIASSLVVATSGDFAETSETTKLRLVVNDLMKRFQQVEKENALLEEQKNELVVYIATLRSEEDAARAQVEQAHREDVDMLTLALADVREQTLALAAERDRLAADYRATEEQRAAAVALLGRVSENIQGRAVALKECMLSGEHVVSELTRRAAADPFHRPAMRMIAEYSEGVGDTRGHLCGVADALDVLEEDGAVCSSGLREAVERTGALYSRAVEAIHAMEKCVNEAAGERIDDGDKAFCADLSRECRAFTASRHELALEVEVLQSSLRTRRTAGNTALANLQQSLEALLVAFPCVETSRAETKAAVVRLRARAVALKAYSQGKGAFEDGDDDDSSEWDDGPRVTILPMGGGGSGLGSHTDDTITAYAEACINAADGWLGGGLDHSRLMEQRAVFEQANTHLYDGASRQLERYAECMEELLRVLLAAHTAFVNLQSSTDVLERCVRPEASSAAAVATDVRAAVAGLRLTIASELERLARHEIGGKKHFDLGDRVHVQIDVAREQMGGASSLARILQHNCFDNLIRLHELDAHTPWLRRAFSLVRRVPTFIKTIEAMRQRLREVVHEAVEWEEDLEESRREAAGLRRRVALLEESVRGAAEDAALARDGHAREMERLRSWAAGRLGDAARAVRAARDCMRSLLKPHDSVFVSSASLLRLKGTWHAWAQGMMMEWSSRIENAEGLTLDLVASHEAVTGEWMEANKARAHAACERMASDVSFLLDEIDRLESAEEISLSAKRRLQEYVEMHSETLRKFEREREALAEQLENERRRTTEMEIASRRDKEELSRQNATSVSGAISEVSRLMSMHEEAVSEHELKMSEARREISRLREEATRNVESARMEVVEENLQKAEDAVAAAHAQTRESTATVRGWLRAYVESLRTARSDIVLLVARHEELEEKFFNGSPSDNISLDLDSPTVFYGNASYGGENVGKLEEQLFARIEEHREAFELAHRSIERSAEALDLMKRKEKSVLMRYHGCLVLMEGSLESLSDRHRRYEIQAGREDQATTGALRDEIDAYHSNIVACREGISQDPPRDDELLEGDCDAQVLQELQGRVSRCLLLCDEVRPFVDAYNDLLDAARAAREAEPNTKRPAFAPSPSRSPSPLPPSSFVSPANG